MEYLQSLAKLWANNNNMSRKSNYLVHHVFVDCEVAPLSRITRWADNPTILWFVSIHATFHVTEMSFCHSHILMRSFNVFNYIDTIYHICDVILVNYRQNLWRFQQQQYGNVEGEYLHGLVNVWCRRGSWSGRNCKFFLFPLRELEQRNRKLEPHSPSPNPGVHPVIA